MTTQPLYCIRKGMRIINKKLIHAIALLMVVGEEEEEGEVIREEVVEVMVEVEVMAEDEAVGQDEDQAAAEVEAAVVAEEDKWGEAVPLAITMVPFCNLSIP